MAYSRQLDVPDIRPSRSFCPDIYPCIKKYCPWDNISQYNPLGAMLIISCDIIPDASQFQETHPSSAMNMGAILP